MSVLAVDIGTSGVRAAIVRPDSSVDHVYHRQVLPRSPSAGFVEFDAIEMAEAVLEVAKAALADGGAVDAVGISNQRASTVVWDRATGEPVGPGIGWQDLRTAGYCLALQAQRHPTGAEPERHQALGAAGHRRPGPVTGPVRRHRRQLDRLDLVAGRSPRLGPQQPCRHRTHGG